MTEISFAQHSGQDTLNLLSEIADLYQMIKADDPAGADPIFSRSSFIARTEIQAQSPGFKLVRATVDEMTVGFSFGYPFKPGRWWAESVPPAPQELVNASKFAVIELDVRQEFRGHGMSKVLLGDLLADRTEDFATLAAIPGTQAHAMYIRWGWRKAARLGGDGPVMDALLFRLPGRPHPISRPRHAK